MGRHDRRRARRLSFSSQTSYVPEEGGLRIGTRWWIRLPTGGAGGSTITPQQVSDDGTPRVSARIEPPSWQTGGAVDIVATLRCPGWGDVALSGAVAGPLDGVSRCPAPYEVRSSRLAGQAAGTITFAGLAGPTVDTAVLRTGSVGWGAANSAGQPPQIEASVDDEGVLHAAATFRRLDGQPHRRGDHPLPLTGLTGSRRRRAAGRERAGPRAGRQTTSTRAMSASTTMATTRAMITVRFCGADAGSEGCST